MSEGKPKIYVIGSFVMGLTIQVPRVPTMGETLTGENFDLGPGGKGVNQAIAAARAGAEVRVSVCVGEDNFGKMAIDVLEEEGIYSESVCQLPEVYTGCGFVTLLESGDNSIIIDPGANRKLSAQMILDDEQAINRSDIVMAQLEVPDEPIEIAMKLGKRYSAINILNPAPARRLPASILEKVDILTPNETEARILLDLPPDGNEQLEELGFKLLELGVKTIVITLGKEGALIIDRQGSIKVPAPVITPTDSTGAGDCFNGNLAYGLGKGWSIEKAVKRAVFAGAYCTGYLGVIKGLPTGDELNAYINKY